VLLATLQIRAEAVADAIAQRRYDNDEQKHPG
jgi:hypothetical protein